MPLFYSQINPQAIHGMGRADETNVSITEHEQSSWSPVPQSRAIGYLCNLILSLIDIQFIHVQSYQLIVIYINLYSCLSIDININ